MPVRSLNSSVFKWPDRETIHQALLNWANRLAIDRPQFLRAGYFGSYAHGDWAVNSDLDVILIVKNTQLPFEQRALEWDTSTMPVPVDLLIYTQEEWNNMAEAGGRFYRTIHQEAVWVFQR